MKGFYGLGPLSDGSIDWTSLVVRWLRLHVFNARGGGLIPVWGTEIPHAPQRCQEKERDRPKDEGLWG